MDLWGVILYKWVAASKASPYRYKGSFAVYIIDLTLFIKVRFIRSIRLLGFLVLAGVKR